MFCIIFVLSQCQVVSSIKASGGIVIEEDVVLVIISMGD